jgi:hypothetical protein
MSSTATNKNNPPLQFSAHCTQSLTLHSNFQRIAQSLLDQRLSKLKNCQVQQASISQADHKSPRKQFRVFDFSIVPLDWSFV